MDWTAVQVMTGEMKAEKILKTIGKILLFLVLLIVPAQAFATIRSRAKLRRIEQEMDDDGRKN